MILSHRYRFIFIKTTKTASTSIEIALSEHCGPEDVITPIKPEDEEIRRGLGFRAPQNYLVAGSPGVLPAMVAEQPPATGASFYNHIPAIRIKALVGERVWSEYYKLCFERHPCERVISFYFWRRRRDPNFSLSEFIASRQMLWLRQTGYDLYTIDGKVAVDKIGRYEHLEADLEEFRLRVGLPRPLVLPRAKADLRTDRRSFGSILTPEQRARIGRLFAAESALLGYEC